MGAHRPAGRRRLAAPALLVLAFAWVVTACGAKKAANLEKPSAGSARPAAPARAGASSAPAPPAAGAGEPARPANPTSVATPRPPAPAPLMGHVTRSDLERYVTWKDLRAQDYTPDPEAVRTIADRGNGVTVLAIVATWCPDSKREVPRFFKIADQAQFPLARVALVAVDRTKKDAEGLTEKHQVTRVPTFVFFRNGEELGRVVEKVSTTLEHEIAAILAR